MKKNCFFIFLFIFFYNNGNSQDYIGTNWIRAKKIIVKSLKKDSLNFDAIQTDSSFTVVLNDNKVNKEELYLHFNRCEICNEVRLNTRCNDCINKHWNDLLSDHRYHWIRINDKKYISGKYKKVVMELKNEDALICPYILLYKYNGNRNEFLKNAQQT